MTSSSLKNAFDVFGLPIELWPDLENLKSLYLQKSAEIHPDRFFDRPEEKAESTEKMAELNQAYRLLLDTKARLRHCIELTTHATSEAVQSVPEEHMSLFMEGGSLLRRVNIFLKAWKDSSSVIERASLAQEQFSLMDELQKMQEKLREEIEKIEKDLREWNGQPLEPLIPTLKKHEALLSYALRMEQQLVEYQNRFHQME